MRLKWGCIFPEGMKHITSTYFENFIEKRQPPSAALVLYHESDTDRQCRARPAMLYKHSTVGAACVYGRGSWAMQPYCDSVARLPATASKGWVCLIGFQMSTPFNKGNLELIAMAGKMNNLLTPCCRQPSFHAGGWDSQTCPGVCPPQLLSNLAAVWLRVC